MPKKADGKGRKADPCGEALTPSRTDVGSYLPEARGSSRPGGSPDWLAFLAEDTELQPNIHNPKESSAQRVNATKYTLTVHYLWPTLRNLQLQGLHNDNAYDKECLHAGFFYYWLGPAPR